MATQPTQHDYLLFRARDLERRNAEFVAAARSCDVVHWHANITNYPHAMDSVVSLRGGPAQVASVHHVMNDDPDSSALFSWMRQNLDAVHVPAEDVAATLERHAPGLPVHVVPYAIEGLIRPRRRPASRAARTDFVVGWSGLARAIGDRKRLGDLIGAVGLLRDGGANVRVLLQGRVPAEALELASRLGVPVEVKGWELWRDRDAIFDDIDMYVSTSAVEGGPLPVLEAAALSLPVAATRVGLGAELVAAGGAIGLEVGDIAGHAEAIASVIELSSSERSSLGECSRNEAAAIAGRSAVDRYERWYSSLLGDREPLPITPGGATASQHNQVELTHDRMAEARELRKFVGRRAAAREFMTVPLWRVPPRDAIRVGRSVFGR